ncbi:polyprenyl synthetase family protein [Streptomyces albus]|uniref:polyprenyl synthetase family protein n=1 Tax=Streptomyces albus TaxID=1888 RepID=UPI003701466A
MTAASSSTTTSPSPRITARLEQARELTLPGLREAVDTLHPRLARACGYHFGWWSRDGGPPAGQVRQGKFLRAALALLAAEAAGGRPEEAVPGAVAVELLHNHSIMHDDVIDADELRRGRRAVWSVYGTGTAVLAGDALVTAAITSLTAIGTAPGRRALCLLNDCLRRMCAGQAADLEFEEGREVTVEDYLQMAANKTSALLAGAACIGALLAGADKPVVDRLHLACLDLGLAWQAANDVEDIWGDPAVTGKPRLADLRQGKTTLPVLAALRSDTPAGRELAAHRATAERDLESLEHLADLITRAGGRAEAERVAQERLDSALAHLQLLASPGHTRSALAGLFRLIVTRQA